MALKIYDTDDDDDESYDDLIYVIGTVSLSVNHKYQYYDMGCVQCAVCLQCAQIEPSLFNLSFKNFSTL